MCAHYLPLGGLPQQPPEGDDGGHAGAVEEEEGGHALQAQTVPEVAEVERGLPLDVQQQPAKQPGGAERWRDTVLRWSREVEEHGTEGGAERRRDEVLRVEQRGGGTRY